MALRSLSPNAGSIDGRWAGKCQAADLRMPWEMAVPVIGAMSLGVWAMVWQAASHLL